LAEGIHFEIGWLVADAAARKALVEIDANR